MSEDKVYIFKVAMTCEGCTKAVTRVLERAKAQGIKEYKVDLQEQVVNIRGTISQDVLQEVINKTGLENTLLAVQISRS